MLHRNLPIAAALTIGAIVLPGCDKNSEGTVNAEACRELAETATQLDGQGQPAVASPEIETDVQLPESPDFGSVRAPIRWDDDPDGAYSIYGLREDMDARLEQGESGQTIVVKGWVQEIYVPPACPEDQLCPPAKQPHFWITDGPDERGKKRAMMVVNYEFPIPEWDTDTQKLWKDQPAVVVEVGKQYTFRGTFRRFSSTGFAHDQGLLEFHSYKAPNPDPGAGGELIWICPPNSDWHPLMVAIQEAQNAAMQERMRQEAARAKQKNR